MKRSKENRIYCSPTNSGWCGPFVQSTYSLSHWFSYFQTWSSCWGHYLMSNNFEQSIKGAIVRCWRCTLHPRLDSVKTCMFSPQLSPALIFEFKFSDCYWSGDPGIYKETHWLRKVRSPMTHSNLIPGRNYRYHRRKVGFTLVKPWKQSSTLNRRFSMRNVPLPMPAIAPTNLTWDAWASFWFIREMDWRVGKL